MTVEKLLQRIKEKEIMPREKGQKSGGELHTIEGELWMFEKYTDKEGEYGHYSYQDGKLIGQSGEEITVTVASLPRLDSGNYSITAESTSSDYGRNGLVLKRDTWEDKNTHETREKIYIEISAAAETTGLPDSSSTKPREAATQPVSDPVGIRALNPKDVCITRQAAFKAICDAMNDTPIDKIDPQEIIAKAAPLSEWALEPYFHPGGVAITQPDAPPEPESEPSEPESGDPDVETKAMHIEIRRLCKADGGDGKAEWKKVMDTFDLITAPEGITDKKLLSRIIDDFGVPF